MAAFLLHINHACMQVLFAYSLAGCPTPGAGHQNPCEFRGLRRSFISSHACLRAPDNHNYCFRMGLRFFLWRRQTLFMEYIFIFRVSLTPQRARFLNLHMFVW